MGKDPAHCSLVLRIHIVYNNRLVLSWRLCGDLDVKFVRGVEHMHRFCTQILLWMQGFQVGSDGFAERGGSMEEQEVDLKPDLLRNC